jgi:hypothetical protein
MIAIAENRGGSMIEKLEVVSPAGIEVVRRRGASPRIADLNGKTVCEVWNGVFKGDQTFPVMRKLLTQKYPSIKIIPYTEFPHMPGGDNPREQRERAQLVARLATEKGAHALISGNGA